MERQNVFLGRADAAAYIRDQYELPCAYGYLQRLASTGGGPVYCRRGKCAYYRQSDLDAWAESRITPPMSKASQVPVSDRVLAFAS